MWTLRKKSVIPFRRIPLFPNIDPLASSKGHSLDFHGKDLGSTLWGCRDIDWWAKHCVHWCRGQEVRDLRLYFHICSPRRRGFRQLSCTSSCGVLVYEGSPTTNKNIRFSSLFPWRYNININNNRRIYCINPWQFQDSFPVDNFPVDIFRSDIFSMTFFSGHFPSNIWKSYLNIFQT